MFPKPCDVESFALTSLSMLLKLIEFSLLKELPARLYLVTLEVGASPYISIENV